MANAFLIGSGSGSGLREKPISAEDYERLSESDKRNPYVIWVITDKNAKNMGGVNVENVKHKACMWDVYKQLSEDDRNDKHTVWLIIDKNYKDLEEMGFFSDESKGSKLYNVTAEIDYSNLVKTVNSLIDRVNELTGALSEISAVLNQNESDS